MHGAQLIGNIKRSPSPWRNSLIAVSVPFGYFTAWMLIPGAYVAFWLCNAYFFGAACRGWYETAAWVCGWLLNVVFCWGAVWIVILIRGRKPV